MSASAADDAGHQNQRRIEGRPADRFESRIRAPPKIAMAIGASALVTIAAWPATPPDGELYQCRRALIANADGPRFSAVLLAE